MSHCLSLSRRVVISAFAGLLGILAAPSLSWAADPVRGGTLRVSVSGSPRLLDPPITGSIEEWIVTSWLYNNLTAVDDKFAVHPDLAESWKAEEGGKVWVFALRKGVKFHSGKEMTSEDVVSSISRVMDPATKSRGRGGLGPIEVIDAIDTYTVKFTLGQPIADFPSNLALPYARIVSKGTSVNLNIQEDGTGPFVLKEFVVGEKVVVARNPNYFKSGQPYVDDVQMTVYPDSTAEVNALKDGKTDILLQLRPDQVGLVQGARGLTVSEVPTGTFVPVVMRADQAPFDNVLVRKALKLTLDREAIIKTALNGHGVVGNDQPLPPNNPFYNPNIKAPKRDVGAAKKLLADAGYPNGLKLTLYTTDARVGMLPLALMTRDMAREAGFDIAIQNVPWDVFLNTVWEKRPFYINNWFARPTTDTSILPFFTSRNNGGSLNDYFYSNAEVDSLLGSAQKELDQEKRKSQLYKAQELIAQDGPAIISFFRNNITAYSNRVQNYAADPGVNLPAEKLWILK